MAKVIGIVRVTLDGVDYGTKQGATLELGGFTKTSSFASGRRTGSSQEPAASKLAATFEGLPDTDIEAIRNFAGQVDYLSDNGIHYSCPNAETMENAKISDNGGGIEVSIEGDPAVKVA